MRFFVSNKAVGKIEKSFYNNGYSEGFRASVEALSKALDSKDRIYIGNGMLFSGVIWKNSPTTIIGTYNAISHSTMYRDGKPKNDNPLVYFTEGKNG